MRPLQADMPCRSDTEPRLASNTLRAVSQTSQPVSMGPAVRTCHWPKRGNAGIAAPTSTRTDGGINGYSNVHRLHPHAPAADRLTAGSARPLLSISTDWSRFPPELRFRPTRNRAMPSDSNKPGRKVLLPINDPSLPAGDPAASSLGLSPAFARALGEATKPVEQPSGDHGFTADDTFRRPRLDGPKTRQGVMRPHRIDLRSGHK